jgi:hypothetical protein
MFITNQNVPTSASASNKLYCVWIRANDNPGAPLVSVWIDPQIRAFTQQAQENDSHAAVGTEDGQEVVDPYSCVHSI